MLAQISIALGRKNDGSWTVIAEADKAHKLASKVSEAIASGEYKAAGIAKNPRIRGTKRRGIESVDVEAEKEAKVEKAKTPKPKTPKAPKASKPEKPEAPAE